MKKIAIHTVFLLWMLLLPAGCRRSAPSEPEPNPPASASCIIGDTLEITIYLDKSWYEIPDSVILTLEIKNISNDTIYTEFEYGWPGYDFAIYDTLDTIIRSSLFITYPYPWTLILFPDSSRTFAPASWNMKNDYGEIVPPSEYKAIGWIWNRDTASPYLPFTLKDQYPW
jgi:hypothetical protein